MREPAQRWCRCGTRRIYGQLFLPEAPERPPLVIFSHELGSSHRSGVPYAQRLAERGWACYTLDYCGGSVPAAQNRSDGDTRHMSMLTEAEELCAVLREGRCWPEVDGSRVVLLGGSQGGVVSFLAARREPVQGLIMMYPALYVSQDVHARFGSRENIPEEYGMFDGWITVGRRYALDMWDLDLFGLFASYTGSVLLLHGDRDDTVDISWANRAAQAFPSCEYRVIHGGAHKFHEKAFEDALGFILPYLEKHLPLRPDA